MPFIFTISNNPTEGDKVNVRLVDGNDVTKTYSYIVKDGDTLQNIVDELKDLINADTYFVAVDQTLYPEPGLSISPVFLGNYSLFFGLVYIEYSEDSYSPAQTLSYDEGDDCFESFLSYHPEYMLALGPNLVSFKDGDLWTHDSERYNSFYGVDYESFISLVFNDSVILKKQPQSISEVSSSVWDMPSIESNIKSYGNIFQKTNISEGEFRLLEGSPTASIKRDINSVGGKINGNFMKGNYFVIQVRKQNASDLEFLSNITLYFIQSPLTKT